MATRTLSPDQIIAIEAENKRLTSQVESLTAIIEQKDRQLAELQAQLAEKASPRKAKDSE